MLAAQVRSRVFFLRKDPISAVIGAAGDPSPYILLWREIQISIDPRDISYPARSTGDRRGIGVPRNPLRGRWAHFGFSPEVIPNLNSRITSIALSLSLMECVSTLRTRPFSHYRSRLR